MMNGSRATLTEAIKAAIKHTGKSVYAVAKQSGVPQPVLQRFVAGQRGLTLATANKLCASLGLELRPIAPSSDSA